MTRLDRRAVGMLAGTVVLVAVMLPLAASREEAFDTVLYATLPLVLGVVGTLIASRQPGNLIGWMFCGLALWGDGGAWRGLRLRRGRARPSRRCRR